jgi:hypothetical protein
LLTTPRGLAQRLAVAGQHGGPGDHHAFIGQRGQCVLQFALDAAVEHAGSRIGAHRAHQAQPARAGDARRARHGEVGVEVHGAEGRLAAGHLDRGAKRQVHLIHLGQRGQRGKVHQPRMNPRIVMVERSSGEHVEGAHAPVSQETGEELASHQAGHAGQQH